ncbi:hypothetical protein SISSUDRAFT_1064774 [Sistotremastrum suecicum HHB10207 ss-3]|uniref:G domain-containing protein n=1 Tax=Sistotremastrum suecicum HHB10207 ss-3 TaxID=1314776 RepID=A0A166A931_9AGAM|nr:hypothetical protein SISSUDRAFT_1064774 [Sistotremastrum suecicum HHB10207 ss-3]
MSRNFFQNFDGGTTSYATIRKGGHEPGTALKLFSAEGALKTGLSVARELSESIRLLDLGARREDDWLLDVKQFQKQSLPPVIIAICGATGAGKSSLMNAILDDNIVPTSGMRACTSVVVEVSYNAGPDIISDVFFLSREEWEAELTAMLQQIRTSTRDNDEDGEGGGELAWQKMKDVYPSLQRSQINNLTAVEIIENHPDTTYYLGKTIHISEPDSVSFAAEINKYIESNNESVPLEGRELEEGVPSLSPLIRLVQIRCNAEPLATGAVLVDLPGVGDTNLARVETTNRYLRKYGMYSETSISFIATKTEDVSSDEIARELKLNYNPAYRAITEKIQTLRRSKTKSQLSLIKDEIQTAKALRRTLTQQIDDEKRSRKRKNSRTYPKGSQKRRKSDQQRETSDDRIDHEMSEFSDFSQSDNDDLDMIGAEKSCKEEMEEKITHSPRASSVSSRLREAQVELKKLKKHQQYVEAEIHKARENLADMNDQILAEEKEKNAFCSRQRSLSSTSMIQAHFREGMRSIDEGEDWRENQNTSVRDYSKIAVKVFTVSSRDYVRITEQVKDGDPVCFTKREDTGIPELQTWCAQLARITQEPLAREFLSRERSFMNGALMHLSELENLDANDRKMMRDTWQPVMSQSRLPKQEEPNFHSLLKMSVDPPSPADSWSTISSLTSLETSTTVSDGNANLSRSIASCLQDTLKKVVADSTQKLKDKFRDELVPVYNSGARKANDKSAQTAEKFRKSMDWRTYRAAIHRYGYFPRATETHDLNAEFALPILDELKGPWSRFFAVNPYSELRATARRAVQALLEEVEKSAPDSLRPLAKRQKERAVTEVRSLLRLCTVEARCCINAAQRVATRSVVPHLKTCMTPGYDAAIAEKGKQSMKRKKARIDEHLSENGDILFRSGAEGVLRILNDAADKLIPKLNDEILNRIPEKVEVLMSVLWEAPQHSAASQVERQKFQQKLTELQSDIDEWLGKPNVASSSAPLVVMDLTHS